MRSLWSLGGVKKLTYEVNAMERHVLAGSSQDLIKFSNSQSSILLLLFLYGTLRAGIPLVLGQFFITAKANRYTVYLVVGTQ